MKSIKIIIVMFVLICQFANLFANDMNVPVRIQAALFTKIVAQDNVLKKKDRIRLLIVYDKSSIKQKNECQEAFQAASFDVGSTTPDKLSTLINDYDVVYFMPDLTQYSDLCREYNKLSLVCSYKPVESGQITVGIWVMQDLPRVLINLSNLEKEGHNFSPNILQIAKVFK